MTTSIEQTHSSTTLLWRLFSLLPQKATTSVVEQPFAGRNQQQLSHSHALDFAPWHAPKRNAQATATSDEERLSDMVGEDVVEENTLKDLKEDPRVCVITPDAELARARHFLSGWTLARYASRFEAECSPSPSSAGGGGEGDSVTPGGGGGGWTPKGPPSSTRDAARHVRRRPSGILTIPTCATVGQVRWRGARSSRRGFWFFLDIIWQFFFFFFSCYLTVQRHTCQRPDPAVDIPFLPHHPFSLHLVYTPPGEN